MKTLSKSIVISMLFASVSWAASPSFSGASGLITMPTAEALKFKQVSFGFDSTVDAQKEKEDWTYKVNLGTFENWELGLVGGREPEEGMFLNVKYYLMSNHSRNPLSIAIGSEFMSSQSKTDIYMVASKKVRQDFSAHLGFKAIFEETVTPTIMGGLAYMVNEQLEILGDLNGDKDAYSGNAGLRFFVTPRVALRAFALDVTDVTPMGVRFTAGISYSKYI